MMKNTILITLLLFCFWCKAQPPDNWNGIYTVPEFPAEFPGGAYSMDRYIDNHLIYPFGIGQGKVIIRIVVECDGNITGVKLLIDRTKCNDCQKEAIEVVRSMPKWKPAYSKIIYNIKPKLPIPNYEDPQWRRMQQSWSDNMPTGIDLDTTPKAPNPKSKPVDPVQFLKDSVAVRSYFVFPVRFKEEKIPLYPEGIDTLINYLKTNLVYPEKAFNTKIQGKVDVKLLFDDAGNFSDVLLIHGMENCPECNEEALRLIKSIPKEFIKANDNELSPKPFFFNTFVRFKIED